jgi:MYXO-CTERM domain-containing protein
MSMTGNTFIGPVTGAVQPASYPSNSYLAAAPSGTVVFVRPNREEPGRAHVVIYNWDGVDSVDVDLSTVLSPGDLYEIRNGQNFFAPAVVSGTFDGALVSLPMSAGDDPAGPIGPGLIEPSERTGKAFNVFVVLPQGSAPPPPPDGGSGGTGGSGASGGSAGVGGAAGAGANGAAAEESGCGCQAPGRSASGGAGAAFGAVGLAGLLRRRRSLVALALLATACAGGQGQPEAPAVAAPGTVVLESGAPRDGWLEPAANGPVAGDAALGASDAAGLASDPASVKRHHALLVTEIGQLSALAQVTPATSPDLPVLLHRLGRRYSELAVGAEADGDPRMAAEARQHALEQYQKVCSSHPGYAKRDEALFDLGTELILAKDPQRARQTMLELIDKYKDSKMVPRAYLAFGEMFFEEGASDPAKLDLAKQAYQAVLKYPPPDNRVYGYASYKLGWVARNQGDGVAALGAFRRTIDFANQFGAGSPSITRLGEEARKDLVQAYVPVGKPESAYAFFHAVSGDDATGDKRTRAMVLRLAQAYGDQGLGAQASVVCQDLLRRRSDPPTCQGCQQVASVLLASRDPAGQAEAQQLRLAIAQLKCGPGP